jgi:hypothetical protein
VPSVNRVTVVSEKDGHVTVSVFPSRVLPNGGLPTIGEAAYGWQIGNCKLKKAIGRSFPQHHDAGHGEGEAK